MKNRLLEAYGNRTSSIGGTSKGSNRLLSSYSEWEKKKKKQQPQGVAANAGIGYDNLQNAEPIIPKPVDQIEHEKKSSLWSKVGGAIKGGLADLGDELAGTSKSSFDNKSWEDRSLLEKSESVRKEFMQKGLGTPLVGLTKGAVDVVGSVGGVLDFGQKLSPMAHLLGKTDNPIANELMDFSVKLREENKQEFAPKSYNAEDNIFQNPKLLMNPEYIVRSVSEQTPNLVAMMATGGWGEGAIELGAYMQGRKEITGETTAKDMLVSGVVGVVNGVLGRWGFKGVFEGNPILGKLIVKKLEKGALKIATESGLATAGEMGSEYLQEIVPSIATKLIYDEGGTWKEVMAEANKQGLSAASQAGIVSAPISVAGATGRARGETTAPAVVEREEEPEKDNKIPENSATLVEALSVNDKTKADELSKNLTTEELKTAIETLDKAYSVAEAETKQTIGTDIEYVAKIVSERQDKINEVAGEVVAKKTTENLKNNVEDLSVSEVDEVNALLDQVREKTQVELPEVSNKTVEAVKKSQEEITTLQTQKKELLAKKSQRKEEAPEKAKEIQATIDDVDQEINGLKDFVKQPAVRPEQQSKVPTAGYSEIRKVDNKYQIFYRGTDRQFSPKKFASQDEAKAYLKENQNKEEKKTYVAILDQSDSKGNFWFSGATRKMTPTEAKEKLAQGKIREQSEKDVEPKRMVQITNPDGKVEEMSWGDYLKRKNAIKKGNFTQKEKVAKKEIVGEKGEYTGKEFVNKEGEKVIIQGINDLESDKSQPHYFASIGKYAGQYSESEIRKALKLPPKEVSVFNADGTVKLDMEENGKFVKVIEMNKKELKKAGFGEEAMGFGETADVFFSNGKPIIAISWLNGNLAGFSVQKDFRGKGVSDAYIKQLANENNGILKVEDPNEAMLNLLKRVGNISEPSGEGTITLFIGTQPPLFSNLAIGKPEFTRRGINEDKITGAEMMIEKLKREQKRGEISEADLKELTGFINNFSVLLDDVTFKVFQGGAGQGSFEYSQKILSIFIDNIKKKTVGFKRTLVHEIWHAASQYLPKEDLAIIKNQFEKEQKEFLDANPEYRSALKLKDKDAAMRFFGGSLDTYKYYSIDEWFAEKMSEETMPIIAEQYGETSIITRIFEHIRSVLKAMYDAVAKIKDVKTVNDIFKDFMSGKNDTLNFQYGLEDYKTQKKNTYTNEAGESVEIVRKMPKLPEMKIVSVPLENINIDEEVFTAVRDVESGREAESYLPILLKQRADGSYDILDGRHRLAKEMREGKRNFLAMTDEALYRRYSDKEEVAKNRGSVMVREHTRSGIPVQSYTRKAIAYMPDITEAKDLTTPILEQLKGKDVISKQFISDLAKRQEVKQVERDLINKVLAEFENKVDVKKFIEKVNSRLLPLKMIESDTYANYGMDNIGADYESAVNPPKTHIYDSPFKHGKTGHFSGDYLDLAKQETGVAGFVSPESEEAAFERTSGLFGHTRAWEDTDEAGLPIRYIAEIQSDIFQGDKAGAILPSEIKKRIEDWKEAETNAKKYLETISKKDTNEIKNKKSEIRDFINNRIGLEKRLEEASKNEALQMFANYKNTWHERLIREELALAAKNGISVLRFPTPYTIAKIEGFVGETAPYELLDNGTAIGDRIDYGGETMVIVKSYGDGSFNAVPEESVQKFYDGAAYVVDVDTLAEEDAQYQAEDIQYNWNELGEVIKEGFEQHKDTKSLQKISDEADTYLKEVLDIMYDDKTTFEVALESWKEKYAKDYDAEDQFGGMGYDVEIEDGKLIVWKQKVSSENFDSPDSYSKGEGEENFNYETDLNSSDNKTVVRFYDRKVLPYVQKIRKGNVEKVEDPNGNLWLETKIMPEDKRPVVAFMPDIKETEAQKLSKVVQTRTELLKQKKEKEKSFAETPEGKTIKEKTILQAEKLLGANSNVQQGIKNNSRFIKERTISDAMGSGWLMNKKGRQVVVEANKVDTYIERGYTKDIEIDSLASEAGFENGEDYLNDQLSRTAPLKPETAIKKHLTYTDTIYQDILTKIQNATDELAKAKDNKNAFFLGMKVGGSVMKAKFKERMAQWRDRKTKVKAAQDFFKLGDSTFNKIGGSRNVQYMSNEEFDGFMKHLETQAEKEILHSNAKAMVISQIQEKQLKKTGNLRRALKFPTIDKMTTDQLKQFDEALETAQPEDEFLTQRMIETLRLTELAGIRTVREAREILNKKLGENFEKNGIKISPLVDRLRWDAPLAESNEFMRLLVEEKDMAFLKADAKTLTAEMEVDKLAKQSRKSVKRTLGDRLVPEDTAVFDYLEKDNKVELASEMTPEQLQLATWLQGEFEKMRDYLIQNEQLKAYRENYITHIRKDFLEVWKNDGLFSAIKGVFEQQQMDEASFEILSGETEEIMPFEKWFQFAMRRSGIIDPSKNVERAYIAYKHTFERKVALDSLIPKIMTYVYSLTPTKKTEKGLVMDRSIRKFVVSWLNSKKGRRFDFGGFLKQGSKADTALLFLRTFTSLIDLGASIPIGIASNFGEQSANFISLGSKAYLKGVARVQTKRGRAIAAKYENFVGKTPWKTLSQGNAHIGNKFMGGMFYLFHSSQVRANKSFLLGAMTDAEFQAGEISLERLAKMKIDMGRWRIVEGDKSIIGNTSLGGVLMQYKTWGIVMLRTTLKNAEILVKKRQLNSREGKEAIRQVLLMSAIGLMTLLAFTDDDDNSFLATLYKKVIRDTLSAIQALDPTLYITDPRVFKFLVDLTSSLKMIATMETYAPSNKKQHGELKGLNKLQRTLSPNIFKQFIESDYVIPKKYNITD